MPKFIIVEIYDLTRKSGYKPGWTYEVYADKNEIPKSYFLEDETHAFWRFEAKSVVDAERQFLIAIEDGKGNGLLWTYDRDKM